MWTCVTQRMSSNLSTVSHSLAPALLLASSHMCFHGLATLFCCSRRCFPRHALLMPALACHHGRILPGRTATTRLPKRALAFFKKQPFREAGEAMRQNNHSKTKPSKAALVFVTSKRMSGDQDCQYWGRLHFIECLLGSCASKPEHLLLLLHFLSHSGCKRLEPEILEQARKKSGAQ